MHCMRLKTVVGTRARNKIRKMFNQRKFAWIASNHNIIQKFTWCRPDDYLEKCHFFLSFCNSHSRTGVNWKYACIEIFADNRAHRRHIERTWARATCVIGKHTRTQWSIVEFPMKPELRHRYPAVQISFNEKLIFVDLSFAFVKFAAQAEPNWSAMPWQNNINQFAIIHMNGEHDRIEKSLQFQSILNSWHVKCWNGECWMWQPWGEKPNACSTNKYE